MKVLDIGCGLGTMTSWLAQQVGPQGTVVAIDNNEYQIKATLKQANSQNLSNIKTACISAYDLESLNETFDLVYCRFILHHVHRPNDVIQSVHKILNPDGIFVAEEGLVSQAFAYPFTRVWGSERWNNDPKDHETEGKSKDGNFGIKLYHSMHQTGFQKLVANLVQPVITSASDKKIFFKNMFSAMDETKRHFLEQGHSESDWKKHCEDIEKLAKNDSAMIAFYQSCQVKGVKNQ